MTAPSGGNAVTVERSSPVTTVVLVRPHADADASGAVLTRHGVRSPAVAVFPGSARLAAGEGRFGQRVA